MASAAPAVAVGTYVRLLGPPAIERDGRLVSVDTRKAIALLAYLVVTGRAQARDHLAALLWPEADQARARSALRRTLSALNSALGGEGLGITRETLSVGELDVDVLRFRALIESVRGHAHDTPCRTCIEALREAALLHHGDFLSGFSLRDSPEFDDWQLAVTHAFRQELGDVLSRLSSWLEEDDPAGALTYARRWLELDRLHEPAHRALMRMYTKAGDRSAALRQYRECVAVLERELGVEPLEETTELYESIREERSAGVARAVAQPATDGRESDLPALPFVGRSEEMHAAVGAYASIGRNGHLIVIGGEPGIGKTRMANELIEPRRRQGAIVLEARCHPEEERMAFGTVVELMRTLPQDRWSELAEHHRVEVARLVPEVAPESPPRPPLDSPAARRRLFEAISEVFVRGIDAAVPGVLFVDDAQWIDESSRDVLWFLVRRLAGTPICVLLTWRTDEVPPAHPLRRMLADATRDERATGITLGRLSPVEVEELVTSSGAAADAVAGLWEETAGVPFFVVEYLRSNPEEGLPAGVRDLLAVRVEGVSGSAAQILAAAAVIGRAFGPDEARAASGRSEAEVAAALEELASRGLIAETGQGYEFTHPKLRDYVYEATTLGRRRLLHGRVGAELSRGVRRRPEVAASAAHHLERAGRDAEAAELFVAAGDHARSIYANPEALAHYLSAIALGHDEPAPLHSSVGDLLTLAGRYGDALASYEKAAALGGNGPDVAAKLGEVHHRLGDWEVADAYYTEALGLLAKDATEDRARVLAARSLNAHRAGRTDAAAAYAQHALEEADASEQPRSIAQARNVSGILAFHRGEAAKARTHLGASLEIAERLGEESSVAAAHNNLALVLRAEGTHELALSHARQALDLCRRIGDRHREAAVHSNLADVLRDLGRTAESMEHLKLSAALFSEVGEPDERQPEIWKLVEW